jgi:predicted anti-sigma-YlaC factor YlaD
MLCLDFETLLTDYIEGVTGPETNRQMAEHAMKCPVCHETLSAVKSTVAAWQVCLSPREISTHVSFRKQFRKQR